MRQLASYLAMPVFLVDTAGNLLFYNEPAETLLGRRFDEAGAMPMEIWFDIFSIRDESGSRIPLEAGPIAVALRDRQPAHRRLILTGFDGVEKVIESTVFPLEGQGGRHLGAVAIFWDATRR